MKNLLIGHRGVGKTSLLQRLRAYHNNSVAVFDLDEMIEKGEGLSVSEIFEKRGETEFRALEKQYLSKILAEPQSAWIALGAGFNLDEASLPPETVVWWVRRPTDVSGRIFLDRPRLNNAVSALDEYRERFEKRSETYARAAHATLILDEGFDFENEPERKRFTNEIKNLNFDLTILPAAFKYDFGDWYHKRRTWGLRFFEIRDDLLSPEQIKQVLKTLPHSQLLLSLRSLSSLKQSRDLLEQHPALAFDCAAELGEVLGVRQANFISFHRRETQSLSGCLASAEALQLKSPASILKIALPIENFEELAGAHTWMQKDPQRRIVLPMSANGRWSWYRLWMQRQLTLNFLREDEGSAADQPTLLQVLRAQETPAPAHFAAILGQPVSHSRTPAEQGEFFAQKGWPVYQIDIGENEWASALPFLTKLGLRAAAVTSPLKQLAFESATSCTPLAQEMKSVNTLWHSHDGWIGQNTDVQGFKTLLAHAQGATGIWGGGGTLSLVRTLVPGVVEFSARSGQPRAAQANTQPETLIWAVSRARFAGVWPTWSPKTIIDLNYSDDSPGRELALKTGARYISGLAMFKVQAQGQREFWQECEVRDGGK